MNSEDYKVVIVLISCPGQPMATALAKNLVQKRVAACATVCPGVESIYWWNGEICSAQEVLLMVKTAPDRILALKEAILAEHPYEVPEILVIDSIDSHAPYASWVNQCVTKGE